jgi:glycolate oxidase FAD binding subunit
MQVAHTLDLSALTGVSLYEPEELVLSAKAGTPVAEVEKLLAEHNQEFAFEPMDYGTLLGLEPGRGTLGGVFAANLSGPRRIKMGAARDHVLGIRAVTGRGDLVKSGGRVVKNVTGYDLSKGLAGSWGTLAVATELTFKVLPRSETELTVAILGLQEDQAAAAMALAMGSSAEVSGAAHLPETVRRHFIDGAFAAPATVLRVDGFAPSVEARFEQLRTLIGPEFRIERLEAETSRRLWREIRDVKPYADGTGRPVWRVSIAPMEGHKLVLGLRLHAGVDVYYDWQGGLIWMRMEGDPEAELVRRGIKALGGHAMLIRADAGTRAAVPVFEPQPSALAALTKRLKEQFDPHDILNPGRMG